MSTKTEGPRILLYDIETAPALGWVWDMWNTNVLGIKQDWYILCYAYKWIGDNQTWFITDHGKRNDRELVRNLRALFDEADIVIAHNGDKFDQRKANARFQYYNMPPPSPYQTIDTLKEDRRYFNRMSHSLKHLPALAGMKAKKMRGHDFQLWLDCMDGDEGAWKYMREYTLADVEALEELYLKLRPWIGTPGKAAHPNLGHWANGDVVCAKCGYDKLTKRGFHRTSVSVFQTYQCKRCKGYTRDRKRETQRFGKGVKTL